MSSKRRNGSKRKKIDMDKNIIDKVLFELDDVMYESGCEVLAEHTRLPDGTFIPGRRYRGHSKISWVVRPMVDLDAWEIVMYPPLSRKHSKISLSIKEGRTNHRTVCRILSKMLVAAEEIITEV